MIPKGFLNPHVMLSTHVCSKAEVSFAQRVIKVMEIDGNPTPKTNTFLIETANDQSSYKVTMSLKRAFSIGPSHEDEKAIHVIAPLWPLRSFLTLARFLGGFPVKPTNDEVTSFR